MGKKGNKTDEQIISQGYVKINDKKQGKSDPQNVIDKHFYPGTTESSSKRE